MRTRRFVYTYFFVVYKISYYVCFAGYGLALVDFLGLTYLFVAEPDKHECAMRMPPVCPSPI